MATPTIEEYLEAIYTIETHDPPVKSVRVAKAMGVSAPTVFDTVRRLVQQGYADFGEDRDIVLTDKGRMVAESLVRRHRLSERWLVDVLGMDWSKVHDEACKLEHALSPEVEERLSAALNSPSTCPHGNPIPGSAQAQQGGIALSELEAGVEAILLRISPDGEKNPQLLDYLKENGLLPGAHLRVTEVAPWNGLVAVKVGNTTASLGTEAASQLWVRPTK